MKQGIEITSNDYNNYIGKYSVAMISADDSDYTVIFQNKKDCLDSAETSIFNGLSKDIPLPLLIIESEDLIKNASPDVRILYNGELNVETLLTGLIIGKIYREEDLSNLKSLLEEKLDVLYNDNELVESLKPLISEAKNADDYDFSTLEDKMFELIQGKLNELI